MPTSIQVEVGTESRLKYDIRERKDFFKSWTYASFEIVFPDDLFDPLGGGPDEGGRVKVVDLVKVEQGRKVGEHLVADSIPRLLALLHFVDDVVGHFVVFSVEKNTIRDTLQKNSH